MKILISVSGDVTLFFRIPIIIYDLCMIYAIALDMWHDAIPCLIAVFSV
jgi:hypothetical protein